MQVACQMVHWIQQALIKRLMDGEVRVNKNEGGSADHMKGHDEISHDQEMVSSEVHEERGAMKRFMRRGRATRGPTGQGQAVTGSTRQRRVMMGRLRGGRMVMVSTRRGRL